MAENYTSAHIHTFTEEDVIVVPHDLNISYLKVNIIIDSVSRPELVDKIVFGNKSTLTAYLNSVQSGKVQVLKTNTVGITQSNSGNISLRTQDAHELGHGMRIKLEATTEGADHDWNAACMITFHRQRTA